MNFVRANGNEKSMRPYRITEDGTQYVEGYGQEEVLLPEPAWTSTWGLASWEQTGALACAPLLERWQGAAADGDIRVWACSLGCLHRMTIRP